MSVPAVAKHGHIPYFFAFFKKSQDCAAKNHVEDFGCLKEAAMQNQHAWHDCAGPLKLSGHVICCLSVCILEPISVCQELDLHWPPAMQP